MPHHPTLPGQTLLVQPNLEIVAYRQGLTPALIAGALELTRTPWISMGPLGARRLFDVGGLVALVALGTAFVVSAVRNTRALYHAEPLPERADVGLPSP